MTYTIEYLENGARKRQVGHFLFASSEKAMRELFDAICQNYSLRWEAARLVGTDEDGMERKLAEWAPGVLTPKASDLGVSFEAQLAEELGLSEDQRERLGHWLKARKEMS